VVFWTRTHLDCRDIYDTTIIHTFLEDRPAAIRGIKELELTILAEDENWTEDSEKLEKYLSLSKMLNLDRFELQLYIGEVLFKKLASGRLQWFSVFRGFKVAEIFEQRASVLAAHPSNFDSEEEEE
jgi:hypothetical protein